MTSDPRSPVRRFVEEENSSPCEIMSICLPVPTDHKDLIHDVALDYYGRRMATCSSDQSVKIWDLQDDGTWRCTANWKTHAGSVWKVTWAHPLYGQLIATCSFDRTAALWEETVGDGSSVAQSHWVKRTSMVDSRGSVSDVQFAPKHLGLQIVTTAADGVIRIYENIDQSNLSQWQLVHEISSKFAGCSCASWSQSRLLPQILAVGSYDEAPSTGKVVLFELVDQGRKWIKIETLNSITEPVHDLTFANTLGRSFHILAVAAKDLHIVSITPSVKRSSSASNLHSNQQSASLLTQPRAYDIRLLALLKDHQSTVWRVSWNITGTILASSGDDGYIRLWRSNFTSAWRCVAVIRGDGTLQTEGEGGGSSNRKLSNSETLDLSHNAQSQNFLSGFSLPKTASPALTFQKWSS
ncbi:hypothetical protein RvY_12948 [Ramazzottius varieornatus]|uniref:Nucleoporin SEH1 n=1 Tax=Ramazzottius varieornatus TaxID=947166 RepID=A0A1D1VL72_RAMVA|nr:hypothetical protein RvY_12948 [Ramazzottius varieornatus]